MDEVREYFGRILGALRVQLSELGANLAPRVNPADPVLAARVIDDAVHTILTAASEQTASFIPTRKHARPGTRPGEMGRAR
jgi:hypothetical protein